MASYIKKGESVLIPFRNGMSISDSQLKPRMYKTMQAFEKSFPGHYLGKDGVELVEYAEVVRCCDCKHCDVFQKEVDSVTMLICMIHSFELVDPTDFCSCGERKDND